MILYGRQTRLVSYECISSGFIVDLRYHSIAKWNSGMKHSLVDNWEKLMNYFFDKNGHQKINSVASNY